MIVLLALGALANFYRNRDPYRAYFYPRADHYLTTHLLDSSLNQNDCLEYRIRGKATHQFFQAIRELYNDKQLIVPDDYLFDLNNLAEETGKEVLIQYNQPRLPDQNIGFLLRQAKYSFFYSPLVFSPLKPNHLKIKSEKSVDPCLNYESPWKKGTFPLLMILMQGGAADDPFIRVLHIDKHLIFIPSKHPALELQP